VTARERLTLRPLAPADAPELLRILETPEVARWWDAPDPGFPLTDDQESVRFTILVDGAVAGLVQFWEEDEPKYRHANIDVYLDPAHHGQGLGTEAVRRIAALLVGDRGHHRITIDPAAANVRAIAAYARAGFRPIGIMRQYQRMPDGTWVDALLMDLLAPELVR
jgi:aminoglycoside 6'-N-acetyltransferase